MIGDLLSRQASERGGDTALVFGSERQTYAQLNARACRLANALAAAGVEPGQRVASLVQNCPEFVEAFFATAKLGAIFVPVNFRLVAREVGQILGQCSPAVLLAGESMRPVCDELQHEGKLPRCVVRVTDRLPGDARTPRSPEYEAWLAGQSDAEPLRVVGADEVQLIVHSSGTTGLPKGAIWTHTTTFASSAAKIVDFGLTPRDVAVVFGPLFHVGPLMDLAIPLMLHGGTLVIGPSGNFDPGALFGAVARERGTLVTVYPTMWRRVLASPEVSEHDLSSLRLLFTGGEPMPVPLLRAVYARFPRCGFVNTYGSTEGGPVTTFLAPEDSVRRIGSVGRPAFGVQVRIADDEGRPLPAGEVGELLVRSPFVCRGYWERPDATAQALREGWWHTGDLAYRDDEGFVWIAGRKKDMIISGAENIYPVEVEQVIATLDGVLEVAVVGVPDEHWGESVAAFVVARPGAALDAARVVEHCRRHLASYKKPRHVFFVDALPRTGTNKVSRNDLRAALGGGA